MDVDLPECCDSGDSRQDSQADFGIGLAKVWCLEPRETTVSSRRWRDMGVSKNGGVSPPIIHFNRFWGSPIWKETPISWDFVMRISGNLTWLCMHIVALDKMVFAGNHSCRRFHCRYRYIAMLLHFWRKATACSNQIDWYLFCRYLWVVTNNNQSSRRCCFLWTQEALIVV